MPKATTATSEPAPVIIGLRNPGSKYAGTRHNIGADAVTALAARHGGTFRSAPKGIPAEVADTLINGARVRLVLPTTFMNESGQAVGPIVRYFSPPAYLVAHDDIDLAFGKIRVHHSRGSGGHNGIKSIVSTTGGTEFWRLRIGVGRPPGRIDPADFVLQRFRPEEDADILIQEAADVLEAFVAGGAEAARQVAGDRPQS
ncbi:MAG: aminoacyl-tRNA hydrolase [Acidimicrobiia bacterium]|nr:aminoacyl-tRNA hydrolase [Acidimicrobiia bacterium]MBT8217241.1 aminoacyl-tRNA hydrolase [Acidimicrobiia bacterium]NNF10062.1 aminoacyl-tRNA hydrolase [Acidimicrobiia bacterium]NNL69059.1 aminoacyl-tRNA hydrolase [Acidimicrobiia bacterium]